MREYCRALIKEHINRGLCLKELIHRPRTYPELLGLAERCGNIIDNNIAELNFLLNELQSRDENDVRDIFRDVRLCSRELDRVEYFGISALYFETTDIGYLNKLVFKIHKEINLPLNPPAVACISTNYYYFHTLTNVIFVPVGESRFLLHLPDLFHEIGHEVLNSRKNELGLQKIDASYDKAITKITNHYNSLSSKKMRETGPRAIPFTIVHIHDQWKTYWINEFFSDLFAVYTLGPAYAWAHLHLTVKKKENVYEFSPVPFPQSHPSDDSRMRMLIIALNKLGFIEAASDISAKWRTIPLVAHTEPINEYQYAYPDNLMEEISELFLTGLKESGFTLASPKKLETKEPGSIIQLLNEAWDLFWSDPDLFMDWERRTIQQLKAELLKSNCS
jgi:hypothetical protein